MSLGAFVRGAFVRGAFVRGTFVRGAFVRGAFVRGAFVRGAFNPRGFCPRGFCPRGFCPRPLGHTLANTFLCYYEKQWLNECPPEFRPNYYKRYVDDIFVLFENNDQIEKFQQYLNTKHINMSFTFEKENNNKLAFPDIDAIRDETGKTFKTSSYRKPTFSGVYTN